MKRTTFLFSIVWALVLASRLPVNAQAQTKLPPFSISLTNGKTFSTSELSSAQPTLLIYFAPDCDHCQTLLALFFKKIDAFKKTQVLLVTFKPLTDLPAFEKTYNTQQYPNLRVGTELKPLYLQTFFALQHTPFTALYDKQKNLVVSYREQTPLEDLIGRIKKL